MELVTINALEKAIQRTLRVNEKEAHHYASIVMDMFGYDDFIIDNILDHEDRRLFYRLQLSGVLCTRQDDVLLHDGRAWRIHYWMFQKHAIFPAYTKKKARNAPLKNKEVPSNNSRTIYSSLPETVWATRKTIFDLHPL